MLPAVLAMAFAIHRRAICSGFQVDDFLNLFAGRALDLRAYLFEQENGHFMPVLKGLSLVLDRLFTANPTIFLLFPLATHLANVALLYVVASRLTHRTTLSALAAGLWGCAPLHWETLQWFTAYQFVLVGTLTLVLLVEVTRALDRRLALDRWALLRMNLVLLMLSATAASGVTTACVFPIVVALMLRSARSGLALLPGALLGVAAYLASGTPRFVRADAGTFVAAILQFVAYGVATLFAAPLVTLQGARVGLLGDFTQNTAVALSAIVAAPIVGIVVWGFVRAKTQARMQVLAMSLLAGVGYCSVAVARSGFTFGQSLSSVSVQARYHYSPSISLILAVAVAAACLVPRRRSRWYGTVALLATLSVSGVTATRITANLERMLKNPPFVDSRASVEELEAGLRRAAHAVSPSATLYVRNDDFPPLAFVYVLGLDRLRFPGIGAWFVVAHPTGLLNGRRIRFVEGRAALLAAIRAHSRPEVAALFVSPAEAQRDGAAVQRLSTVRQSRASRGDRGPRGASGSENRRLRHRSQAYPD